MILGGDHPACLFGDEIDYNLVMDVIFQRWIDNNFSELPGLRMNAIVPVAEQLVNELISVSLQETKNIEYCRLSIGGQNWVTANIKTSLWPWPFSLKLKLFKEVDFSGSPKIRAFLENHVLLGRLGTLFKALPDGIMLYEDQVSLDIGSFLQTPEQKRYLDLVKAVEISTEAGRIIFDVKIEN
jgi:hypothetical protein